MRYTEWEKEYTEFTYRVSMYPTGQSEVQDDSGSIVNVMIDELYLLPALMGEVGELASIYAKATRDKNGNIDEEDTEEIKKELGDILFMITRLADVNGVTLYELAEMNYKKLQDRFERGVISGSGDNR